MDRHNSYLSKQYEDCLKEKQDLLQQFKSIVEKSSDGIVVLDKKGSIKFVNKSAEVFLGKSARDLMGREFGFPVSHGEKSELELFNSQGNIIKVEMRALDTFWDGQQAFLINLREVTENYRARRELYLEIEFNKILGSLAEKVLVGSSIEEITEYVLDVLLDLTNSRHGFVGYIDPETGFLVSPTLSREMWHTCSVSDKKVVFEKFSGLWGWVLKNKKSIITNKAKQDSRYEGVIPEGHIEVEKFLSAPAMIQDKLVGQIALANTSREYGQKDLQIVNRVATMFALAVQRRQFEEGLIKAKEESESANQAKNEFLATMSHEVKTPLNIINGMLHLLEDEKNEELKREYIETALTSSQNLLGIMNDILDISKLEAGKLEIESREFELEKSISSIVEIFIPKAKKKGIELSFEIAKDIGKLYIGDPVRLRQAVFNLVGNAVKFTDKGKVTVEVLKYGSDEKGRIDHLQIIVKDTGVGIEKEKLDYIFKPFMQADSSIKREHSGSGLGLGIVKRLVELMQGSIKVESEPDQGTKFCLEINLQRVD